MRCILTACHYLKKNTAQAMYDSEGNVISTQDAAKNANSFNYDNNNNLKELIDAKGSRFTYNYDDKHNITGASSLTGHKIHIRL